jgi:hypothetical protein
MIVFNLLAGFARWAFGPLVDPASRDLDAVDESGWPEPLASEPD